MQLFFNTVIAFVNVQLIAISFFDACAMENVWLFFQPLFRGILEFIIGRKSLSTEMFI